MSKALHSFTRLASFVAVLAGCGARSDLQAGAGSGSGSGGGAAPPCPQWVATHAAVQVSSIGSIIEAQSALATPSGVLVGYADAQVPPVDSTWHARLVGFGDGALGAEQTVFHHETSGLGWTRISMAQGFGRTAATASDDSQGMLFVPLDDTGAPQGSPVHVTADQGHGLLATSSGYTALRSPWDPSDSLVPPVSLSTLDVTGAVVSNQLLVDTSAPVVWYERFALAGGDFMLVWDQTNGCAGCRAVGAQHFSESGSPMAPAVTLHAFGPQDDDQWVAAASPDGLLMVRLTGGTGPLQLVAEPFDADGNPAGLPQTFAQLSAQDSPVLGIAAAPGGDFLVAWAEGVGTVTGSLFVQSVGPDGASEGPATMLGMLSTGSEEDVLVVASPLGAMVVYENDVPNYGIEVYAVPLACGS